MALVDLESDDAPPDRPPDDFVTFWLSQLARYEKDFNTWERRCGRIIRRYRDEREESTPVVRYNVLWSNVQTLSPAIYSRIPKPLVERRFQDSDPIGRYASTALERSLEVQSEVGYFDESMRRAVQDYLLVGRGVLWERYEPTYGEAEEDTAPPPVTYEKVCTDYVYWRDFRHSPARIWRDVWWIAKRDWLTKKEGIKRFGDKFANVPMKKRDDNDPVILGQDERTSEKACIWEIWDKNSRQVIFIAEGYKAEPLEVRDDPLNLSEFWPCPRPLYATTTNDTLIPVPDYLEYQDQARELDSLTGRIGALTKAVKVVGMYDASEKALVRLLNEGVDNTMVPVESWAAFSEKGGIAKSVDFMPLKDIVTALLELYNARDRVKQDMYEITGISDIVRGQASAGSAKTATEQRIKGQFANLRLQDRQTEVARFARDAIAITGEIVSEHFSPETIADMTNIMPLILDDVPEAPPMQMPPDAPPELAQMQAQQQQQMAEQQRQQQAQQIFAQAMELLRNDKLRTFRVDIETDSTIEPDAEEAKRAATELVTATLQGLTAAGEVIQFAPELVNPVGDLILFAYRKFRVGRSVEASLEEALEQIKTRLENPGPPPPDPKLEAEKIKAEAEGQKAQMGLQTEQMKQQGEAQKIQGQMQLNEQQLAIKQAELQLKREELELKRQEMAMQFEVDQQRMQMDAAMGEQKLALEGQRMSMDQEASAADHERGLEAGERKHELGMETMEAKAKAAKAQPKGGKK